MAKVAQRLTPELRELFPDNFLWGASASSHQIEGDTYNQWTKWELESAADRARRAKSHLSRLPIWKDISSEATDPANYVSGRGINHRQYYKKDVSLLKPLGLNCFCFSIEWSRIEPEEGTYDLSAIQHYKEYIRELQSHGIEPIVTLWHWTMPVWFEERGGFRRRVNLRYWRQFIDKMADELDWSSLRYVATLNEPSTFVRMMSAATGFPVQKRGAITTLCTYWNLATAHKIAYRTLKAHYPDLNIGSIHLINKIVPLRSSEPLDRINAWLYWYLHVGWFMARIRRYNNFIGLNYYFTDYRSGFKPKSQNPKKPASDLGWYMEPAGIETAISETWRRYHKPILITENGIADMHDQYRLWWITETMHALSEARRGGANVIGYIHRSLLDSFEWQFGWFPRFGLVRVERETQKRTVKISTKAWARWLRLSTKP